MMQSEDYLDCIQSMTKNIIRTGEKSRKPSEGSICTTSMQLLSGTDIGPSDYLQFSANTLIIGRSDEVLDRVIEFCLQTMILKEESEFAVQCSRGLLKLRIRLDDCFFKPYVFQMSDPEKLSLSREYKEQGVALFKAQRIHQAFYKFSKALQYLLSMELVHNKLSNDPTDLKMEELLEYRIIVYNNIASCQLYFNNVGHVLHLCGRSLSLKPNVKAYYRRAQSYIYLKEFEKAEIDLLELLKLETSNKAAIDKLKLVRMLDETNRLNYNTTVKNMFS